MANDDRFLADRVGELSKPLDANLIKERPGGGKKLKYISGKTAMDAANLIFGFGNWSFRLLSCDQVVLKDPLTDEAVGIEYKAVGELTIRGAVGPIVEIGSQPVAAWNVFDLVMQRRINAAGEHGTVDESPFTAVEKKQARATIVEAHEQAKKAAATDVLKRCLRLYGDRFGLALYDEESIVEINGMPVQVSEVIVTKTGDNTVKPSAAARINAAPVRNQIAAPATPKVVESNPHQEDFRPEGATQQALARMIDKCKQIVGEDRGEKVYNNVRTHVAGDLPNDKITDQHLTAMWNMINSAGKKQPAMAGAGK